MADKNDSMISFGDHLEQLRKMVIRVIAVIVLFATMAFCFKEKLFDIIMAPLKPDFVTFAWLRDSLTQFGVDFDVSGTPKLIATDISAQFMAHITMALYFGLLLASPYIGYQLLGFVMPALYKNERHYASRVCVAVYMLFIAGLLLSYFIMFPVSCRFLTSYSVSPQVETLVDISSYLSLFVSLSLLLGAVFQLPVISWFLAKIELLGPDIMRKYRRHAIIAIAIISSIITPPDALSMVMVALPLYLLYELSIIVVSATRRSQQLASNRKVNG